MLFFFGVGPARHNAYGACPLPVALIWSVAVRLWRPLTAIVRINPSCFTVIRMWSVEGQLSTRGLVSISRGHIRPLVSKSWVRTVRSWVLTSRPWVRVAGGGVVWFRSHGFRYTLEKLELEKFNKDG